MVSLFDGGVKMLVALPSLYLGPLAQSLTRSLPHSLFRTLRLSLICSVSLTRSTASVYRHLQVQRAHPLRKSTNTALQMAKFSREDVLPNNKRDSDALGTECAIEFPMCNPAPSPSVWPAQCARLRGLYSALQAPLRAVGVILSGLKNKRQKQ